MLVIIISSSLGMVTNFNILKTLTLLILLVLVLAGLF